MSPSFEILKHEQTTVIVHSLVCRDGDEFEKSTEVRTHVEDPMKRHRSKILVYLGLNNVSKVEFREWRKKGKVYKKKYDSSLKKEDLDIFKELWFRCWKPKMQMKEVIDLGEKPLEKLELEEDYEEILRKLKEQDDA